MNYQRLRSLFFLLFFMQISLGAQTKLRQAYIEKYKEVAIEEMMLFGIPASITLAQGILESGDGESKLAKEANNHFGIKCHLDWDGPKIYHDDDEKGECFRKYKHAEESYRDHSVFLRDRSRYADLFKLDRTDYKSWAHGLKKAGYATNPNYPKLLIKIIEENNLHQYDLRSNKTQMVLGEHMVFTHENDIKYVEVGKEDSWESLSAELEISVDRLLKYNEVSYDRPLSEGDIVFIQKKRKKGKVKSYQVEYNEDMYSISQKVGVRMKYLYKRNGIMVGGQPEPGQILLLK
jgi:hypothetical protein